MRIKITLSASSPGLIDFNYQHQIQGLIYSFLHNSNPDYSRWLHQQGFICRGDKRFKLFAFSGITFQGPVKIKNRSRGSNSSIRSIEPLKPLEPSFNKIPEKNGTIGTSGFSFSHPISFQIASPVDMFIQHLVDGIFKEGNEVRLSRQLLNITSVETLGTNETSSSWNGLLLKPLESPIFVKKPMPEGQRDLYLFPGNEGFDELLNQNLVHKYETIYDRKYEGRPLTFDFNSAEFSGKSTKSFKVFKNGKIVGEIKGTLLPFKVSGSEELIKIGLDCGFGQLNSMGCGYVVL